MVVAACKQLDQIDRCPETMDSGASSFVRLKERERWKESMALEEEAVMTEER